MKEHNHSAQQIVSHLSQKFSEPILFEGTSYNITTSIGVSEYRNGDNLERIIMDSDSAMYEAKRKMAMGVMIIDGKVTYLT